MSARLLTGFESTLAHATSGRYESEYELVDQLAVLMYISAFEDWNHCKGQYRCAISGRAYPHDRGTV